MGGGGCKWMHGGGWGAAFHQREPGAGFGQKPESEPSWLGSGVLCKTAVMVSWEVVGRKMARRWQGGCVFDTRGQGWFLGQNPETSVCGSVMVCHVDAVGSVLGGGGCSQCTEMAGGLHVQQREVRGQGLGCHVKWQSGEMTGVVVIPRYSDLDGGWGVSDMVVWGGVAHW